MLIGEYTHNLDTKGRISVPAKFRSELGSSAIVTRGLDKCLFLYPKTEWDKMASKLASLPISSSASRSFARMMLSGAMEVEIDKQGRALLPSYLREYAGLGGQVIVTGVFNRAEIWDKGNWEAYSDAAAEQSEANAEKLTEWEL
jgi:MraZ protein